MKQTNKYWAKDDEVLLADIKEGQAPSDPFKTTYVKKQNKKNDSTEKALTKNYLKNGNAAKKGHLHQTNWRWTEVENRYTSVKGRLFDKMPVAFNSPFDYNPLFSSFTKDKIFVPPMTSKEAQDIAKKIAEQKALEKRLEQEKQAKKDAAMGKVVVK